MHFHFLKQCRSKKHLPKGLSLQIEPPFQTTIYRIQEKFQNLSPKVSLQILDIAMETASTILDIHVEEFIKHVRNQLRDDVLECIRIFGIKKFKEKHQIKTNKSTINLDFHRNFTPFISAFCTRDGQPMPGNGGGQ